MQLSSSTMRVAGYGAQTAQNSSKNTTADKTDSQKLKESFSKIDAKELTMSYFMEFNAVTIKSSSSNFMAQAGIFGGSREELANILGGIDFATIGYNDKDIMSLDKDEASTLVAEDGFFGIAKTAERIASFVLAGAGDDVQKLQAGRDGILQGFKDATKVWGGKLPEISEKTIDKALEAVDKKLAELGANSINITA